VNVIDIIVIVFRFFSKQWASFKFGLGGGTTWLG